MNKKLIIIGGITISFLLILGIITLLIIPNETTEDSPVQTSQNQEIKEKKILISKNNESIGEIWLEKGSIENNIQDIKINSYLLIKKSVWENSGGAYPTESWGEDGSRSYGTKTVTTNDADFINVIYIDLDDNFTELGYEFDIVEK